MTEKTIGRVIDDMENLLRQARDGSRLLCNLLCDQLDDANRDLHELIFVGESIEEKIRDLGAKREVLHKAVSADANVKRSGKTG